MTMEGKEEVIRNLLWFHDCTIFPFFYVFNSKTKYKYLTNTTRAKLSRIQHGHVYEKGLKNQQLQADSTSIQTKEQFQYVFLKKNFDSLGYAPQKWSLSFEKV